MRILREAFKGKTLGEITPQVVERFKTHRLNTFTVRKKRRSKTSVNREFELLSKIFTLAIKLELVESNPCSRVDKFKLQNQRYRYLLPDEEPRLLAQCIGKREHLATMIPFAIGTGARKSEQLNLKVRHCEFSATWFSLTILRAEDYGWWK